MTSATFVICASGDARRGWLSAVEATSPSARVIEFEKVSDCQPLSDKIVPTAVIVDLAEFPALHDPLVARIQNVHSPAPVVLSSEWLPHDGLEIARASGIAACIPRHYSDRQRQLALSIVINGGGHYPMERFPPPALVETDDADTTVTDDRSRGLAVLTPRQRDVALWIVRGSSSKEIAKHLGIAEQVVRNHVTEIYRRIHVHNRPMATDVLRRMEEIRHRIQSLRTEERDILYWMKSHLRSLYLDAGQVLFRKGDDGKDLFYIQSGTIALDEIGEEMGPREIFGEIGAFTAKHRRTCTARAKTAVTLFRLDHKHVQRLFFDYPEFALHVVSVLAQRVASGRGL